MRNYQDSDYAVNKYSANIVYRFADGIVEITPEEYLKSNPNKNEQDFADLKAVSDEIYYMQDRDDTRYGKRKRDLSSIENSERFSTAAPDMELIQDADRKDAMTTIKQFLDSGDLTEVQHRRFIQYFFQGKTTREIAESEGTYQNAIWKSIHTSEKKLKKFFNIGWSNTLKKDVR